MIRLSLLSVTKLLYDIIYYILLDFTLIKKSLMMSTVELTHKTSCMFCYMLVINLLLFSLCTVTVSLLVTICTTLSSLVIIVAIIVIVLVIALTMFWKKKRRKQEHEIGGNKNKGTNK